MIATPDNLRAKASMIGSSKSGPMMVAVAAAGALLMLCCGSAAGQGRNAGAASRSAGPSRLDQMVREASAWGNRNDDGVYTCGEWKKYLNDLFTKADRNHDGFVDAKEFDTIRAASKQFKDADVSYFDDNGDGRLSRSEFVDKPNPFFLEFDLHHDCRVTLDEIVAAAAKHAAPGSGLSGGGMR